MPKTIDIANINSYKDLKLCDNTTITSSCLCRRRTNPFSFRSKTAKKRLHNKIKSLLLDYLEDNNRKEDFSLIEKHWDKIFYQACKNIGVKPKHLTNGKTLKLLLNELSNIILAIEAKGIFPYRDDAMVKGEKAKNFIKYLLHDIDINKDIMGWNNFKHLFIRKDENFINELREEFHNLFILLYNEIITKKHFHDDIIEMFIGHILSMYVLTDPVNDSNIKIPQKISGKWQLTEYVIEAICLTPSFLGHPIHAYALIPIKNSGSTHPLLVFKSTPYPSCKTSLLSTLADFTPGFGVGESLYMVCKKKLGKWVRYYHQKFSQTIKVYGQSLGGTLAYHLAYDHTDHVEIHAYVPAGLFNRHLKKNKTIKGKTFSHNSDIISLINKHPEDIDKIKVLTQKPRRNPFIAHFRLFGCDKTILLRVNQQKDNKRFIRLILSSLHQILSLPLFIIKSVTLLTTIGIQYISKLFLLKLRKKTIS
jgi:hypothetical protein